MRDRKIKWAGQIALEDMTDEHLVNAMARCQELIADNPNNSAEWRNWYSKLTDEQRFREQELEDMENV